MNTLRTSRVYNFKYFIFYINPCYTQTHTHSNPLRALVNVWFFWSILSTIDNFYTQDSECLYAYTIEDMNWKKTIIDNYTSFVARTDIGRLER